MNLAQLRAFHLVAAAGSFTHAARTAGLAQPTLSAQVRALEAAYGVSLFDRRGRGARLTPLGQSLHRITTQVFAAEEEARMLLAGNRWAVRGHLRVAADSAYHAMPVLAAMRAQHRGLSFELKIDNSANVLSLLQAAAVDVAITAHPVSDPRLAAELLRHDRLVVFLPQGHPWARRKRIRLKDIAGQDLVLRERGSITREVFEARLAELALRPRAIFEVQTREAVREAVAAGFGLGVVFASEMGQDPRFIALAVEDTGLDVAEYAVCQAERRQLALVAQFFAAAASLAEREGWLAPSRTLPYPAAPTPRTDAS